MRFSRPFIQFHSSIFLCFAWSSWGAEIQPWQTYTTYVAGNCFTQPLIKENSPPKTLTSNKNIEESLPFALGTSHQSFLEIKVLRESSASLVRMGSNSALEFRQDKSCRLYKGAFLFSKHSTLPWNFDYSDTKLQIDGSGTWMIECQQSGIKLILLEGKISVGSSASKQTLSSGDLVLISSSNPKGTNPIKIDLPLLLSTSRLINSFPARLNSNSRLFSAAQVQTLRVKRKYDALVGEVSKEKKLQLWTVPPK